MIRSLRSRVLLLAFMMVAAIVALGLLLAQSIQASRNAFTWVTHTQAVMISLDTVASDLRRAESNLRGYLLTGSRDLLAPIPSDLAEAQALAVHVEALVADNPPQERRAHRMALLAHRRSMLVIVAMQKLQGRSWQPGMIDRVLFERAKASMDQIDRLAGEMRETERTLLVVRAATAERRNMAMRQLLLSGLPVLAILMLGSAWLILVSIDRPLCELLDVVGRFGAGDRDARARVNGRGGEFGRLGRAYNDMAEKLVAAMNRSGAAEADLARANAHLLDNGRALERRSQSVSLVSEMAQRMQAVRGGDDLQEVLRCFLPKLLAHVSGALYVHNNSRNRLVRLAAWGDPAACSDAFGPDECWALRRGQAHAVACEGADVVCAHAAPAAADMPRYCQPLLAGGEVLGLLYVEGALDDEQRFRLELLMETIALGLVNEGLRKQLREQSIRDPLTQLFNRRYLEESLALETARSARAALPLTVVMADVDHFKRFNDTHGHAAGDLLLQKVAEHLRAHFRDGDLVCRYGGEEFTIIAPGATLEQAHRRLEALRVSLHGVTIAYEGRRLGPVSMSFGIGCWDPAAGPAPASLLADADQALYRAKRLGRDRIESAPQPRAAVAA